VFFDDLINWWKKVNVLVRIDEGGWNAIDFQKIKLRQKLFFYF